MPMSADVQQLDMGEVVELYDIDLTVAGYEGVLRFTPSAGNHPWIKYGGLTYLAYGIDMSGFSRSSQNEAPEPTLVISNVDKGGNALLAQYDNLIGAKVTRRRTLSRYLDTLEDGVTPNANASWTRQFIPEIWYIEQKEEANRSIIKWRMKSVLDLGGLQIPRRRVLKTYCERVYRIWDTATGQFRYSTVNACPYAGTDYFDRFGNVTTAEHDECDKTHKGCGNRFDDGLPTWAFPGADRIPS